MAAVWPTALPAFPQRDGFQRQQTGAVISTPMEVGLPKRRPRSTSWNQGWSQPFIMSQAQLDVFEAFFRSDLKLGALPFDWTYINGEVWRFVFSDSQPYSITPLGLDWLVNLSLTGWLVGAAPAAPLLDFSIPTNSQYVPLLFEEF